VEHIARVRDEAVPAHLGIEQQRLWTAIQLNVRTDLPEVQHGACYVAADRKQLGSISPFASFIRAC
jgi:hypothetical protein